jgi:hypothetical protein
LEEEAQRIGEDAGREKTLAIWSVGDNLLSTKWIFRTTDGPYERVF